MWYTAMSGFMSACILGAMKPSYQTSRSTSPSILSNASHFLRLCRYAIPAQMAYRQWSMNKILVLLVALLAACTTTAPTPTPPSSAWGAVFKLGQSEQSDAPAFWPFADHIVASWIGADGTGIHQDSLMLTK